MAQSLEQTIFAATLLVQLLGVASVFFARLSVRSRVQCVCQRAFYGCLVLVGAATVATLLCGSGYWASSGATLALMAVGATIDCGRAGQQALI